VAVSLYIILKELANPGTYACYGCGAVFALLAGEDVTRCPSCGQRPKRIAWREVEANVAHALGALESVEAVRLAEEAARLFEYLQYLDGLRDLLRSA
jgi:predicted  nucleic acid-binding Zn-ribbon protein